MRISEDIKKLGEDIISSYKLRIKTVREIVSETHNMLTDFQKEHKIMTDGLRKNLDVDKVERKKYVTDLLKKYDEEQKVIVDELRVMADELKKSLGKGETNRLEEFNKMMADVQNKQADRNKYVADLLQKFADEQKVIADEHSAMAENWKVFNKTMSNLKIGKPIFEKKVKVRPVAEAIKEEKPVEKPKPKPKPAKKEQPWEKDIPIEDKVLAFINAHPNGVKVGDMEEPLDVTRMRLGVFAKKLLDSGKVKKIDKVYFPI